MKKAGDHTLVTAWKVIWHGGINIRDILGEYKHKGIVSSGGICDMLRPPTYVGFTDDMKELRRKSLGEPADLRGN